MRPGWTQRGWASWYGEPFDGRRTASGAVYDMRGLSAAHRTLPFGTLVEVRNLHNGNRIEVVINDRGPFVRGRIIDLSWGAARALGMDVAGIARVEIRVTAAPGDRWRAPALPVGVFTVQVGAFADRDRALDLALGLEGRFPDVRVESAPPWHRVRVGHFPTRRAAEEALVRLQRMGLEGVVVRE